MAVLDSPAALEKRIAERGMDAPTMLGSFYDALDPFRRQDRTDELNQVGDVRLNRDFSPTCYYYAQALWASWWRGAPAAILRAAQRLQPWMAVVAVLLVALLMAVSARLSSQPARVVVPYAVFVAGAGGMALEVVLLLGLQSLYGYVYSVVGYVVGMLMLGLAVGAWFAQRRVTPGNAWVGLLWALFGLAVAAKVSDTGLTCLQRVAEAGPLAGAITIAVISVLMALTGLAVGAAFPAGLALVADPERGIRRATALYAADLIGASGGAIIAGLLLIPLFGVGMTCALVALLATSALVATLVAGRRGEAG